ncbi:MAG TPA: amidophosphoribosyltransferase [Candidatus Mcinerneyibacteriales bacterium]|nr:amidophosphoribosyltransferase [Candidatus Mcinerneyibacteriales bacterium]HPE21222.1 amidophosphoribosyltransferase [Candidatus Mcinerneyibacteriales bacterium]HPQ90040.1 amidophosphoribosyltransferase [Candidatus Mcinerneyibacteriales bacterium]
MCGVIGILKEEGVQYDIALALQAIQHRGQDSCGIATKENKKFFLEKDDGLVSSVFTPSTLASFQGNIGMGHVRYPTMGSAGKVNAQPFFEKQPGIFITHNGNIINYHELRKRFLEESLYLTSSCDVEPVLYVLAEELMSIRKYGHTTEDLTAALKKTYQRVRGAFTIVGIMYLDGEDTMFACRDPYGIRPGVWGEQEGSFMVASESVAMEMTGFEYRGDIPNGSLMVFKKGKKPLTVEIDVKEHRPCIFEYIYFARPDSIISGHSVYDTRLVLGRMLAEKIKRKGIRVDVVIPVPDTARPAATAIAEELDVPVRDGFIKNRYSGRTFIMPSQYDREFAMRLKHNTIEGEFKDKRVLIVDDSIVRGTTTKHIVSLVGRSQPKELHIGIFSPPVYYPCYYGIDISRQHELIARKYSDCYQEGIDHFEEKMAHFTGADSLTYLDIPDVRKALGQPVCAACFDGDYPLPLKEDEQRSIENDRDEYQKC